MGSEKWEVTYFSKIDFSLCKCSVPSKAAAKQMAAQLRRDGYCPRWNRRTEKEGSR